MVEKGRTTQPWNLLYFYYTARSSLSQRELFCSFLHFWQSFCLRPVGWNC